MFTLGQTKFHWLHKRAKIKDAHDILEEDLSKVYMLLHAEIEGHCYRLYSQGTNIRITKIFTINRKGVQGHLDCHILSTKRKR